MTRIKRNTILLAAIGFAALMLACSTVSRAVGKKYKIGDKVADFTLKDDRGRTVSLSQYRGKIIVLNFYASW
jgi:cytochrome oxidase Cu insertion factor (SCO1/SenC/PrrC family)